MKPFPAYLKERERYISFTVESRNPLPKKEVVAAVCNAVTGYVGTLGAAAAGFRVIEYDPEEQKGILRAGAEKVEEVIAALALIRRIAGEPASVLTHDVSGTLKRLKKVKKIGLFETIDQHKEE